AAAGWRRPSHRPPETTSARYRRECWTCRSASDPPWTCGDGVAVKDYPARWAGKRRDPGPWAGNRRSDVPMRRWLHGGPAPAPAPLGVPRLVPDGADLHAEPC